MAEKGAEKGAERGAEKAAEKAAERGAEPLKTPLTASQRQLTSRRNELDYWRRNAERMRRRNLVTGLTIGALVVGVFSYTIFSVRQERVLEEMDDEARINVIRGPRTGANS